MIIFRPLCWIKTLWNILIGSVWNFYLNDFIYQDGHEYEQRDDGSLICIICGKVSK